MRHLSGKDLAWLQHGFVLWRTPEAMARDLRGTALREGPRHWIWRYAWGLIEDEIHGLWPKKDVSLALAEGKRSK